MTRPLSSLHDGLTPDERARYEAAQVDPPRLPAPGTAGLESIGSIFARLKARTAGGVGLNVPKSLALVPVERVPGRRKSMAALAAGGTASPEAKQDTAARIERMRTREPSRRTAAWVSIAPVQGYPGQFMEESAKEVGE